MYTIGIDVGTTNCKVCLFQAPAFELIKHYSFRTPKIVDNGNTEFDIRLIWTGILHGLKTITQSFNSAVNVSAIAVASVGEAGVLLDEDDHIIGPALTWYDTRPQAQLNRVLDTLSAERIYSITGIPAHPNYSLSKIKWLQENIAGAARGSKWLCLAEYIAFKLCGEKRSEYSLASRTMALNLQQKKWDDEILQQASLPASLFSPLVYAGTATGNLSADVAQQTGLSRDTLVAIAGHDHMCGSVAIGLKGEEQILNSTGTTEGLLTVSATHNTSAVSFNARMSNGIHVLQDLYTLYASLPSAGYAIEWFRNLFALDTPGFLRMVDLLNTRHQQASAENIQGIFIPHLRGSGPPDRNTWSKALIYGLDDKSRPEDILRFIFQGLCFELKNLLETCEALTGRHYPVVHVIGSACKNPYWLQLKATILNREIIACDIGEAVSKGAAMLAAQAAGFDLHNASVTAEKHHRLLPESNKVGHYQQLYAQVYQPLYQSKMLTERQRYGENL